VLAQAFRWKEADALRFRPEDRLWPIYHFYYPRSRWWHQWVPGELELESLVIDLQRHGTGHGACQPPSGRERTPVGPESIGAVGLELPPHAARQSSEAGMRQRQSPRVIAVPEAL